MKNTIHGRTHASARSFVTVRLRPVRECPTAPTIVFARGFMGAAQQRDGRLRCDRERSVW